MSAMGMEVDVQIDDTYQQSQPEQPSIRPGRTRLSERRDAPGRTSPCEKARSYVGVLEEDNLREEMSKGVESEGDLWFERLGRNLVDLRRSCLFCNPTRFVGDLESEEVIQ